MKKKCILFLAIALGLVGFLMAAVADSFKPFPAPLAGKKIAVFLDDQYQIDEAFYTPLRLREAGADVKIVSHGSPFVTREVHRMYTDMTPAEAVKIKWDGFVVIGGFSPLELREDKNVIDIVKDVYYRKGLTSAI